MRQKIFLSLFMVLLISNQIYATTYTVTNTLDSGAGSLRTAITSANSHNGPDTVAFNIPTSDAGYNLTSGTWTITLATMLPYLADLSGGLIFIDGNTQTVNQGNTNANGPEIIVTTTSSLNTSFLIACPNSTIRNITVTGFVYGVLFYNSTCTNSTIREMYLGTNFDGTAAVPNQYGVGFANGATGNNVINCVISGNTMGGIGITGSTNNNFKGNKIGTDRTGTMKLPNNYGIAIDNAAGNIIGGTTTQDLNLISGNITAGIVINGTASTATQIKGNYIGTNISGTDSLPNGCGIILAGARNTVIGGNTAGSGNVISGNYQAGIVMNGSETNNNSVKGNLIGTNKDGNNFVSNHTGVMLKSNSNQNVIGGSTTAERNIISGNLEIGVYIEASDSNIVKGNFLGPDISGNSAFMIGDSAIQGNGIELNTVSKYNIVGGTAGERNIISGNRVYGLVYYGNSSYNNTSGNYIGVNAAGTQRLANATGICVDGGSNHNIINNNVLSGNKSYGIFFVTTGTYYNEFKGNLLGVNATNTDTIPNYIGLIIAAGTRYNIIGGTGAGEANIISGNYYDGIEISDLGTDHNQIIGNIIGASSAGGFGNFNGIGIATNPRNNIISHNTISGNKYMGIILFEHSDSNYIENNNIGVLSNGVDAAGNGGAGIAIIQGSSNNIIGPGNIIANNDTAGIILNDNNTLSNTITQNAVYKNGTSQIDIFPPGPNPNDPGDPDSGPNLKMNYPEIFSTGYNPASGHTFITGMIDYNYQNPSGIKIEVFCSYTDSAGIGPCMNYLGSSIVDSTGNWVFFAEGITDGDSIAATATDIYGNTSEISPDFKVITGIDENMADNSRVELFPNPAGESFCLSLMLNHNSLVKAFIFDISGHLLRQLISEEAVAGVNKYAIGTAGLSTGLYFIKVETADKTFTRKISIIK
ncbi:MAG TPA: right-handed parallel beta-helix repeat-containing protein [Bacteroidales bacterium]|nr:right-handed parallel beta-helix repeat-containing protein [Bacteroidales bacterium]